MIARSLYYRRAIDRAAKAFAYLAAAILALFFAWICLEAIYRGVPAFEKSFVTTENIAPYGLKSGFIAEALAGSLTMLFAAALFGVPTGVLAGLRLSEFGERSRFISFARFSIEFLYGAPTILFGLTIYLIFRYFSSGFSIYSGALALATIVAPLTARATARALSEVPHTLREAAYALGGSRREAILGVVLKAAKKPLLATILLAIARVSGETAALLFTAGGGSELRAGFNAPTANLSVAAFELGFKASTEEQKLAWGAALALMIAVMAFVWASRAVLKERTQR